MRKALFAFLLPLMIAVMLGQQNSSASSAAGVSKPDKQLPVLKKELLADVVAQLQEVPVFDFQLHPVTKSFWANGVLSEGTPVTVACKALMLHDPREISHRSQSFLKLLFPFHDFG